MSSLDLKVLEIKDETAFVRHIVLGAKDGTPLPATEAGAHITITIPGVGLRSYSLIDLGGSFPPRGTYMLGIRREDSGEGGSLYMHRLRVGDSVQAEGPKNVFAVRPDDKVMLIAGGIGITPIASMAAELKAQGRPFRMVYAARSMADFAFLPELKALCGEALTLHADQESGSVFDMAGLFATLTDETVYICGPKPMIKAAVQAGRAKGWPQDRVRFELFYSLAAPVPAPEPEAPAGDQPFEVVLKSTGKSYVIPADKTILDVLVEAGVDPMFDCKRGECGVCQVGLLEGEADHRDIILSESERAANKVIQICISRAKSPRLLLDL